MVITMNYICAHDTTRNYMKAEVWKQVPIPRWNGWSRSSNDTEEKVETKWLHDGDDD